MQHTHVSWRKTEHYVLRVLPMGYEVGQEVKRSTVLILAMERYQALFFLPMDGVISIWWKATQAWKWVFKPVLAVWPLPLMMCCTPYVSTYTGSLLWHPELVWPSAGMWSEAGNVWAMKACVYPGYSHPPPPARGKTDTTRIALFILFDAISFCLLFKPPFFALCGSYIFVIVCL